MKIYPVKENHIASTVSDTVCIDRKTDNYIDIILLYYKENQLIRLKISTHQSNYLYQPTHLFIYLSFCLCVYLCIIRRRINCMSGCSSQGIIPVTPRHTNPVITVCHYGSVLVSSGPRNKKE